MEQIRPHVRNDFLPILPSVEHGRLCLTESRFALRIVLWRSAMPKRQNSASCFHANPDTIPDVSNDRKTLARPSGRHWCWPLRLSYLDYNSVWRESYRTSTRIWSYDLPGGHRAI